MMTAVNCYKLPLKFWVTRILMVHRNLYLLVNTAYLGIKCLYEIG